MASLTKLRQLAPSVMAEYFQRTREAEEAREREVNAATRIQAAARGFLMRRRIFRMTLVAIRLQRWWRGHLGRLRGKLARATKDRQLRRAYFDAGATTIQRHWRGHWSRARLFNFYSRRRYLAAVSETNRRTRQQLSAEADRAASEQRTLAEEHARRMFDQKVGRLHHLVSTATQPGIFNSPYALATGSLPLVAGAPVEEHLRATAKTATMKLPPLTGRSTGGRSPNKGGNTGDAMVATMPNGDKVHPRMTLRQTVKYDAVQQALVLEDKIHVGEMLSHHALPFNHYTVPHRGAFLDVQSNRNVDTFYDMNDPSTTARHQASFTPRQQAVSEAPFNKYIKKAPVVLGI